MFDRQERELTTLTVLTLADFKEHFNNLFFDSEKTKRFDLQLTSLKHAASQSEWSAKNAIPADDLKIHVSPAKRTHVKSAIETFKKSVGLHSDAYKANFAQIKK